MTASLRRSLAPAVAGEVPTREVRGTASRQRSSQARRPENVVDFPKRRLVGRASIAATMRDILKEEVHALRREATEDARMMLAHAERLRHSAMVDGRFNDYADSVAICARLQRWDRRDPENAA